MDKNRLKGKKIAVLGFGVEGESSVDFLLKLEANLSVFDVRSRDKFDEAKLSAFSRRGVVFKFDSYPASFSDFDLVVRSPGIRPLSAVIEKIKNDGIEITSSTKLFFDLCPAKIIGVTGTKGKGTTSSLIYEMLKKEGFHAFLGGNIGIPPLSFLDEISPDSKVVLELSSFQLQDIHKSPHIAVILMVTSEHLDYHKDHAEYIEAKRNILRFQTPEDYAVINRDYPASNESDAFTQGKVFKVSREMEVDQGCFVKDGFIRLKMNGAEEKIIDVKEILIPGRHNYENVCAAVVASKLAGAGRESIISVLKTFKGLAHRLELVREVNGVKYYNDSFSTTPETAIAAIEAFEAPEILILGGSSKKSDFRQLGKTIREAKNVKAIIGVGDEWPRIKEEIGERQDIQIIEDCFNMPEIVNKAREIASPGDVIILSPACASFGMFKNYKDRGDQFKTEVNNLS